VPQTGFSFYPNKPVPQRYHGVWRRTLLSAPGLQDTTTTVLWLQTSHWHADLRIPAKRPDFSGVSGLDGCNAAHLAWLGSQHGFAGLTEVVANASSEICTWHRLVDFQPPTSIPDAGTMQFEQDKLIEIGVHQDYLEQWTKLPDSDNGLAVLERIEEGNVPTSPRELLFVAGQYVMHVRDRLSDWPSSVEHGAAFESFVIEENISLLDMEISFGRRTPIGWKVLHSVFPWLENKFIRLEICNQDKEKVELRSNGVVNTWRKNEWSIPR
jgi:hypothetical protein